MDAALIGSSVTQQRRRDAACGVYAAIWPNSEPLIAPLAKDRDQKKAPDRVPGLKGRKRKPLEGEAL